MWGEARIIRGSNHSVNRIKGLFNMSGRRYVIIGVFAFRRGSVKKAKRNAVFKE